ncbi:MAG: transglutaminase domain-containing protein [Planctomycetota bacterium]|jgi:hypothetical protein|nr:transglutaminase domain-containing protein [Planctomycetota bacterium]
MTSNHRTLAWLCLATASTVWAQDPGALETPLERAGAHRATLEAALAEAPAAQQPGLRFLIEHMPQTDLESLPKKFILEHLAYAYRAWNAAPWKDLVPEEIFLNNLLPYASINERRDRWRKDFYERFAPLVATAKTPAEAAAILNQKIFGILGVKYSTKRPKADQSPYESIEAGMASCTGLSVLLVDACRAVGVPARFVGTPRWSDDSGNHSWVEIWDDGWHFTGAAEPTGDVLDRAWFTGRAAKAQRDVLRYGIYAVSYKSTPQHFPMVWSPGAEQVHAVNVTDRYTSDHQALPEGAGRARFVAILGSTGERCRAALSIRDAQGESLFEGATKDERFDANDHVTAILPLNSPLEARVRFGKHHLVFPFAVAHDEQLFDVYIASAQADDQPEAALEALNQFLTLRRSAAPFAAYDWARVELSAAQAAAARTALWDDHAARIRTQRKAEMKARSLELDERTMPFWYAIYGDKPAAGRSLWISLHGGGGTTKKINDGQWENQKRLYRPAEGVYLAPRAPTNTWNLWHQTHIDKLFDRLIENMIVFEDVDPDRVYVMGYSAGGDGVYQLAPRMADRWAAAAMMAGHPNDAQPDSLRNTAFALHVGGKDAAYKRNAIGRDWKKRLAKLRADDPKGYQHQAEIHEDKGHWMDREDAVAVPWMAKHRRELRPKKIVWRQDDVTHPRFYWLAVDEPKARSLLVVERQGQTIRILKAEGIGQLSIRLDDTMLDLDQPVTVNMGDNTLFEGVAPRTMAIIEKTLRERGDPVGIWSAEITFKVVVEDGG